MKPTDHSAANNHLPSGRVTSPHNKFHIRNIFLNEWVKPIVKGFLASFGFVAGIATIGLLAVFITGTNTNDLECSAWTSNNSSLYGSAIDYTTASYSTLKSFNSFTLKFGSHCFGSSLFLNLEKMRGIAAGPAEVSVVGTSIERTSSLAKFLFP